MTSSGAYAAIGAKLVEQGYAAIPIMPGTKRPGALNGDGTWVGMDDWQARFRTRLPMDIEVERWCDSDGGVCAVLGPPSGGAVAADIDTDDPGIRAAILSVLPETMVGKAGQKGETLFYRAGPSFPSRAFNIPGPDGRPVRVLDLLGPGKQTVLPPSVHPDTGQPYRWTRPETLDGVAPEDLPWIEDDVGERIAEALKPFGYAPDPPRPERREIAEGEEAPHRRLNNLAMADLGAWVPDLALYKVRRAGNGYRAVATWRSSHGGRPLERRSPNLKIHPEGIRDFHDGDRRYTPLDLVMCARSCELGEAFEWLSDRVGFGEAVAIELQPRRVGESNGVRFDAETGEVLDREGAPAEPPAADDFTRVPGLLGEITEWIVSTARRPNRLLALGSALTLLGTLAGRQWAGPTRSGTHLYVVGLAPTGSGKDHAAAQIHRLMQAAGASAHIGPDEFMSMPAVLNLLIRMPLSLCAMDEFGAFLKGINGRKAGRFEQGITKTLRSAWGRSFGVLMTPEWAGRSAMPIKSPALSIFGISTAEEFYGAMEGGDVINGVLNRFLVLRSDGKVADRDPELDPTAVPERLVKAMDLVFTGGNPLSISRLNDKDAEIEPHVAGWADEAARAVYADTHQLIEARVQARPEIEPFVARVAEIGLRLATIRAIGLDPASPQITAADMTWGRDLALASAEAMMKDAALYIAETERQQWSNRILRLITKRGMATARDIQMSVAGALRSADIKDILGTLADAGAIEKVDATNPSKDSVKRAVYRVAR